MLLLTGTSDILRVTTSTAAPIECHASWVDNAAGVITPGRTNTDIGAASTTTVLGSPAAGVQRNLQTLLLRNSHGSMSNSVTVEHFDGTTSVSIFSSVLAAGETCQFVDGQGFQVMTTAGAVKVSQNQGTNTIGSGLLSVVLSSDVVNNNAVANSIADVTGLSFPVTAGKQYWFQFLIPYTAQATATGSRWALNGPSFSALYLFGRWPITATTDTLSYTGAYDLPAASNASSLTVGNVAWMTGVIIPSADGSVIARFASEIANSAITAKAGANIQYQQLT